VQLHDNFTATQLYRIAQEALHNAAVHASASKVIVGLRAEQGLELEVRDDGKGMPDPLPRGSGSGLRIMHHRAGLIGAKLVIESRKHRGTSIRCFVSLN
jgi:two-component system CheB/CheR fusion protein